MKIMSWRLMPLILFIPLILFLLRGLSLNPKMLPSAKLGKPLPAFELPILGDKHAHMTPKNLQGQVTLLNVWASWCEACMEEHLFLMQLMKQGVSLYGLNYKDHSKEAKLLLNHYGNPYVLVGEDRTGTVGIDLGVYGAPETFLIDKEGIIRYKHVGLMTAMVWQNEFLPRIQDLQ